MIEIIERGNKKRITCKHCGAVLSYEPEDVKEEEHHFGPMDFKLEKFINCPQCQTKIALEATR